MLGLGLPQAKATLTSSSSQAYAGCLQDEAENPGGTRAAFDCCCQMTHLNTLEAAAGVRLKIPTSRCITHQQPTLQQVMLLITRVHTVLMLAGTIKCTRH
jgi:hypothetical protein